MKKNIFKFYTKQDWTVIIVLLVTAIIVMALLKIVGGSITKSNDITSTDSLQSPTFQTSNLNNQQTPSPYYNVDTKRQKETFYFDPNTADSTQLLRLGLAPYQVRNIYRYRAAGGVYSCKEDFAKLYGLTKGDYDRLSPYIHIADEFKPASEFVSKDHISSTISKGRGNAPSINMKKDDNGLVCRYKLKEGETVSINAADTSTYQKVPGIGSYFAKQIVRYGKQLGGYYSKEQLLEIDGFPEEALKYFNIEESADGIKKIKINKLSLSELRRHPYINFYQAREIIDYHRKNGPLKSVADMQFFTTFTSMEIQRLAPYLEF